MRITMSVVRSKTVTIYHTGNKHKNDKKYSNHDSNNDVDKGAMTIKIAVAITLTIETHPSVIQKAPLSTVAVGLGHQFGTPYTGLALARQAILKRGSCCLGVKQAGRRANSSHAVSKK